MNTTSHQFEAQAASYASFIDEDPTRGLHHQTITQKINDLRQSINNPIVLDIGCGNGKLARMLAEQTGARVSGFDISAKLIEIAQQQEWHSPLGIQYAVADQLSFRTTTKCDAAVSVMVLPYAPDITALQQFFACAHQNLKPGTEFHSVIFNPEFTAFDQQIGNRIFDQIADSKVRVNFLDPKTSETKLQSTLTQFSRSQYELAAKSAGFNQITWQTISTATRGAVGAVLPYALVTAA